MAEKFERTIGAQQLILEVGELAGLANGAVTVRYGDTILLAAACVSTKPREGIDFFPLTVDFEERLYAIGKIPGSFFRREGRPSTDAILACRLTDRPIRPLFPKGFRNDVQVTITVLSADQESIPDVLGTIGASAALCMSEVPFAGPVSSVRIGRIDGEFVVNPTVAQTEESDIDLESFIKVLKESTKAAGLATGLPAPAAIGIIEGTIMLMDATRKWANAPISLPKKEYMEHARDLWSQFDLPPLKPKEPWHGVSLGFWPEEEQALVSLAEQGREDEAAQLLLSRRPKLAKPEEA
ncbi:MAG: hypothetical protein IH796_07145 [Deltaproteobacteria bacterium]|nr:hypothetical protein [Deltaproteobacteria bacterium]